jgi:hypothetical protein
VESYSVAGEFLIGASHHEPNQLAYQILYIIIVFPPRLEERNKSTSYGRSSHIPFLVLGNVLAAVGRLLLLIRSRILMPNFEPLQKTTHVLFLV